MSKEFLRDREHALEEVFFAEQDRALLRRLKEADAKKSSKESLAAACGITDDELLEKLVSLGVDGATVAALSLVPLVLVAWADGKVEDKEREAVVAAAVETGMAEQGAGRQLLDRWLATRPPPQLLAAWTDYIRAISPTLNDGARKQLKADLLDRAQKVAEASGGILNVGWKTSPAEKEMLAKLDKAFAA
ncbi:MAG: hypothetical protein ICV73_27195 [Acetobacteraceae bacterium]|nr:hypothetical protein [Acetobacteraceae bacterium]